MPNATTGNGDVKESRGWADGERGDGAVMTAGTAIIGASERTLWSYWLVRNLRERDASAPIWIVNPQQKTVYGIDALGDVADLPETTEVGVVVLRADRCVSAVRALADRGTRDIVVVSSGFREAGTEASVSLERDLVAAVEGTGARLIGPNCVGFADYARNVCAISEPIPEVTVGPVSVVSQSGGLLASCMGAIAAQRIGVDKCYSIGNGAAFGVADAIASLAANDTTEIVCCVLESIGPRQAFEAAVQAAKEQGKHVVVVKVGRSAKAREVAVSHTGAVVGDDAMVDAWLRRIGVYRANSISEAGVVVAALHRFGVPNPTRGVFIATGSGGGCGVATDLVDLAGVRLADLDADTVTRLRTMLPSGAYVGNPLDVTGAGADDAGLTAYDHVMRDPNVGLVLQPFTIPWPDETPGRRWHRDSFEALAGAAEAAGTPLISSSFYPQERPAWVSERSRGQVLVQDDLGATIAALGVLYPRGNTADAGSSSHAEEARPAEVLSELPGRELLSGLGFDVVPGGWALDEAEVVELAATLDGPWVVKVASETIEHKGRVGGVKIGLVDELTLRAAARDIAAGLAAHDCTDQANGYLVQQMVFGPEILVGLLSDEDGRRSLNLGVGGWAAEAYRDVATLLLPLEPEQLDATLRHSAFGRLLGASQRAELHAVVAALAESFSDGALSRFDTVEINPVILTARGPLIADALLVVN